MTYEFIITLIALSAYLLAIVLHTILAENAKKPVPKEILFYFVLPTAVFVLIVASLRDATSPVRHLISFIRYGGHPPAAAPLSPLIWPTLVVAMLACTFSIWKFQFMRDALVEFFEPKPIVFVRSDTVVVYTINDHAQFNKSGGEQKIADILRANPKADLKQLETALGIKIVSMQRKEKQEEQKTPPGIWT